MKTLFTLILLFTSGATFSRQLTVSNIFNITAQFIDLQDAIDIAISGDTILIASSPFGYSGSLSSKTLCFIGDGAFNSRNTFKTSVFLNYNGYCRNCFDSSDVDCNQTRCLEINSGTRFIGLNLFLSNRGEGLTLSKCVIDRCVVQLYSDVCFSLPFDTLLIINSVISEFNRDEYSIFMDYLCKAPKIIDNSRVIVYNSYIIEKMTKMTFGKFLNCSFFGYRSFPNVSSDSLDQCAFLSCIFYGNQQLALIRNSSFINCLTFSTNQDTLPYGNNQGTANFIGNPQFVRPEQIGVYSDSANFKLQVSSPARNAGYDGTDIGPTGGLFPMDNTKLRQSPLPEITFLNILNVNSTLPSTGTLNVQVKAVKPD
jgi:hypothetical protein